MSLLIVEDATRAPELFEKSANVYVRMAHAEVAAHYDFIKNFNAADLDYYLQLETEKQDAE